MKDDTLQQAKIQSDRKLLAVQTLDSKIKQLESVE